MINVNELIAKFQEALDQQYGYIWGKVHEMWSDEKQIEYARDYKDDVQRRASCEHGGKWAGHWVTDCSGIFVWAFRELGGQMYHGSNTMFKEWCTHKGTLNKGVRNDSKPLLPGTAVFTGDESNRGHVGLFVGDNTVIEAAGTLQGVTTSKATDKKWTYWGELKGVSYSADADPQPKPGQAIVTGTRVALREGPSKSAKVLTRVDTGEAVNLAELPEGWLYVNYRGKNGFMMTEFLREG